MSDDLIVPDPRTANVPAGWWEHNVLPVVQSCDSWDRLDEYEGQLLAMASLIEAFGGDNLEFKKALRVVEYRRGELADPSIKKGPKNNSKHGIIPPDVSAPAVTRYRQIARHWAKTIYPHLLAAKNPWQVTQAYVLRLIDRQEHTRQRRAVAMVKGLFPVLYADPPWQYEHVKTNSRAVENQYPTLSLDQICRLKVPAAQDAVLFLWATNPKLAEAMDVIEAWGFTYRSNMAWVKSQIGMGYYVRQQHELLLIAAKGSLSVPAEKDRPPSVLESPRTKHSAKPPAFYDVIERMYPDLPKVELFLRGTPHAGWQGWGDEATA